MALYAFDGTNNIDEENDLDDTNVVRFREVYSSGPVEYLEGVGTRFGALGKVLGGLLGMGGRTRIDEMMDALTENYNKGITDIDIIGFSRGAALAVHFCNSLAKDGIKLLDGTKVHPKVRFLGLWDLVGSFGLSFNNVAKFQEINIGWDIENVPSNVAVCYHAMAMDERREAFNVTRLSCSDNTDMEERWFRGNHGDIGGGNQNPARSNIAFNWVIDAAEKAGISFNKNRLVENKYAHCDWDAPIFQSKDIKVDEKRKARPSDKCHQSADARMLKIGENHSVDVHAKLKFNWARLKLVKGHTYKIWAQPQDTWVDSSIDCNAAGWTTDQLSVFKQIGVKQVEKMRRVPEANWFELIGSYDNDNDEKSPLFRIGLEKEIAAEQDGELYLFANDLNLFYWNNKEQIKVFIERVA